VRRKGMHYVFRFDIADPLARLRLLRQTRLMAKRPGCGFTWYDAANIKQRIIQHEAENE